MFGLSLTFVVVIMFLKEHISLTIREQTMKILLPLSVKGKDDFSRTCYSFFKKSLKVSIYAEKHNNN